MKKAIFLFETTGYAAAPFTAKGWETWIVDIQNTKPNSWATYTLDWNILEKEQELIELAHNALFVFGMPPCTDLASSGAAHFAAKARRNPSFQKEAVYLAHSVERIGEAANIPWALENPRGRLSTLWRKPDWRFHPHWFGGYLPEDDEHPHYPDYIAARDAYPKETFLWHSKNFPHPPEKLIPKLDGQAYSKQHRLLGGKSEKTKRIRSASPRGFFTALETCFS